MASRPASKASILRLPPEILMLIVGVLSRKHFFNVALVCRAFNSAVLPLLYRKFSFCVCSGGRIFRQLEYTNQANPSLLKNCRCLRLYTTPHCLSCDHKFLRITSLIGVMSKVESLSFLYNGRTEPGALCRLILEALHRMRGLKLFRLQCSLPTSDLQKIMDALDSMPSLRVLSLWGLDPRYRETKDGDSILTAAMHRTAPFTSLKLMCDSLRVEDLEHFIRWPKTLTRLRLVGGMDSEPVADLPTLGNWLSIHKMTLRSIRIGPLDLNIRGRLLDLTAFTALESLSIQPQVICLPGGEFPYQDVHLLLGPKLHTFTLEHPLSSVQIEFGDAEEQWIRHLAKTATLLKSALRGIQIIWHVDDDNFGSLQDRVDRLNRESHSNGVQVGMEQLGVDGMD